MRYRFYRPVALALIGRLQGNFRFVNNLEKCLYAFVVSWLARDVRDFSIFGYPPCWCSTAGKISMCLYAYMPSLFSYNGFFGNGRVPSIEELCRKIPILSEYCEDSVKRRYLEKSPKLESIRSPFPINSLTRSAFLPSKRWIC